MYKLNKIVKLINIHIFHTYFYNNCTINIPMILVLLFKNYFPYYIHIN